MKSWQIETEINADKNLNIKIYIDDLYNNTFNGVKWITNAIERVN